MLNEHSLGEWVSSLAEDGVPKQGCGSMCGVRETKLSAGNLEIFLDDKEVTSFVLRGRWISKSHGFVCDPRLCISYMHVSDSNQDKYCVADTKQLRLIGMRPKNTDELFFVLAAYNGHCPGDNFYTEMARKGQREAAQKIIDNLWERGAYRWLTEVCYSTDRIIHPVA